MRARRDESGAIMVITGITLVLMLGISALAIDVGVAHAQQRKLQNGADAAALGAAQDLAAQSGTISNNAVADAERLAAENLPSAHLSWSSCTDPGTLAFATAATKCVSFSADGKSIRVRIPRQTFSTLFGGVFGIRTLNTSKAARATITIVGGGSGVEPFTVLSGFGAGDFCLDAGGNGNSTQPCDGPTTGNFGLLDFASCSGLDYSLTDDIAAGADHPYGTVASPPSGDIADNCTSGADHPNTVNARTGNVVGQEGPALVGSGTFADGGASRLRRWPANTGDFSPGWETTSDGLDNRPLWEFIPSTPLTGVPDSCQRTTFTNLLGSTPSASQQAEMYWGVDRCIFEYTCGKLDTSSGPTDAKFTSANTRYDCNGPRAGAPVPSCGGTQCRAPVFTANTGTKAVSGLDVVDLAQSPRFVYLPQMFQTVPVNGSSGSYEIKRFRAIFMEGIGPNNGPRFEPGPWNSGAAPVGQIANVTGFMFPAPISGCTTTPTDSCGTMLPGNLGVQPISLGDNAVVELTG